MAIRADDGNVAAKRTDLRAADKSDALAVTGHSDLVRPRSIAPLVDHSAERILDAALVSAMRDRETFAIRRPIGSDA